MIKRCNLILTKKCNMFCDYCIFGKDKPVDLVEEVDPEIVKTYFPQNSNFWINFFGGEPLLEFDYMIRLADAIKNYNPFITFSVTTNGTLLTKERVKILNDLEIRVILSHDGKLHSKVRGTDDPIIRNPDLFLALKNLTISATMTKRNYDFYNVWDYFTEFSQKHGIKRIKTGISVAKNAGGKLPEELLIKDMPEFELMLDKVIDNLETHILNNNFDNYEYEHFLPVLLSVNKVLNGEDIVCYCKSDKYRTNLDVKGNLYSCNNIDKPEGHISKDGLKTIMNNSYIDTAECQSCEAFIYCGGGCLATLPSQKHDDCYQVKQQFTRFVKLLNRIGGVLK